MIVDAVIATYLIVWSAIVSADGLASKFLFKVLPMLAGLVLLLRHAEAFSKYLGA